MASENRHRAAVAHRGLQRALVEAVHRVAGLDRAVNGRGSPPSCSARRKRLQSIGVSVSDDETGAKDRGRDRDRELVEEPAEEAAP